MPRAEAGGGRRGPGPGGGPRLTWRAGPGTGRGGEPRDSASQLVALFPVPCPLSLSLWREHFKRGITQKMKQTHTDRERKGVCVAVPPLCKAEEKVVWCGAVQCDSVVVTCDHQN